MSQQHGGDAVSPAELKRRIDAGEHVSVLDVRNRDEVEAWRIEGETVEHANVPYMKFVSARVTGDVADLVPDLAEPVVVVCPRGEASDEVAGLLRAEGIEAYNLAEGMHGWARLFEARELDADAGGATVVQYRRPSSGCLSYAVYAGGEALVVDPLRPFVDRYAADAADRGASIEYVLDTHVHADHVSGLRELAETADATPVMSGRAVARGVTYDVRTVADGDALDVGGVAVEVVETPGHTSGMVSLAVGGVLLTGDTLFVQAVPRLDLEEGDEGAPAAARDLHGTLTERLARFDDDTVVAPGHYGPGADPAPDGTYTAPLGAVRGRLPVFSQSREAFVESALADLPPRPANFETIIEVNLGRESADDEAAFELELGPNNCAAAPAD